MWNIPQINTPPRKVLIRFCVGGVVSIKPRRCTNNNPRAFRPELSILGVEDTFLGLSLGRRNARGILNAEGITCLGARDMTAIAKDCHHKSLAVITLILLLFLFTIQECEARTSRPIFHRTFSLTRPTSLETIELQ